MKKSRTTTGSLGFRNRVWVKPVLDTRIANTIKAQVQTQNLPAEVLETIFTTYQIAEELTGN